MSQVSTWYPQPDASRAARSVTDAFHRLHGHAPAGVWAAPGRVNVIGEHVDYNQGLCLPFALEQRTFVAVRPRDDDRISVWSAQEPLTWEGPLDQVTPGAVPGWAGYAAGVPWALRAAGHEVPGLDIVVDGQVPRGSGLSSSAALECAVAVALDELAGLGLASDDAGRAQLAAACVRAENEIAGAPTGGMDQAAALRARAGHALLLDCRDFSVRHEPFDLAAHRLALLVIDTRARHALVDGQYGGRRAVCEQAARLLGLASLREVEPAKLEDAVDSLPHEMMRRLVRHVVTEIDRVRAAATVLETGRVRDLGPLLDASHRSLREDFQVSCEELDLACEAAADAGALGARMTGGGFGGSAIALVDSGAAEVAADAVTAAFDRAGYAPPAFLHAVPSGPAGRVIAAP